jgi:hypothetical protein
MRVESVLQAKHIYLVTIGSPEAFLSDTPPVGRLGRVI